MARISELHYSNAYAKKSGVAEFAEFALSPDDDPAEFTASFYEHTGKVGLEVRLDHPDVRVNFDEASGETVFQISSEDFPFLLTDPTGGGTNNAEAVALTNTTSGDVASFLDIGGGHSEILAQDGAAKGAVSLNVATPTSANKATYSIQFNQPNPDIPVFVPLTERSSGETLCFASGTRVDTVHGPCAVETLKVGDCVLTRDHGSRPIRWLYRQSVRALGALAPIEFSVGWQGLERSLRVSPQHRVLLSGWEPELLFGTPEVLVPACHLVDGDRVFRRPGGIVLYHHILFDTHELIRAHGLWTESFHPGAQSLAACHADTRTELLTLFPHLADPAVPGSATARTVLRGPEARVLQAALG
ncbi:MAG: Hint domain-containing protein [Pseudomonadota bacterium]